MTQIAGKEGKKRKGNEGGRLPSVAETGDQGFPRRENPESVLCPHGRFPAQEAAFMGAVMTNQNADAPGTGLLNRFQRDADEQTSISGHRCFSGKCAVRS